jgi:hypothetical protein
VSDPNESPETKASRLGLTVRYPGERELFIDIDSETDRVRFLSLFKVFQEHKDAAATFTSAPSPSGKPGHVHVVVTLSRPVADQRERIVLQALLGSDTKRELVACVARWRTGEQSTTKLSINDEVLREEGVAPSDFGRLERIRLVRMVKKEGHQRWFVPTALALSKLEAFGRGEQAGAAE